MLACTDYIVRLIGSLVKNKFKTDDHLKKNEVISQLLYFEAQSL